MRMRISGDFVTGWKRAIWPIEFRDFAALGVCTVSTEVSMFWDKLRGSAGPFPPAAFAFVQAGLRHTVEMLADERDRDGQLAGDARHVTGQELCLGLRDYAIAQYGLLARTVLSRWNIRRTEDFGRMVFALVEAGLMRKSDEDSLDDFQGVFEFDEAFATPSMAG